MTNARAHRDSPGSESGGSTVMPPLVVLRVKDLVHVQFEFINLSLETPTASTPFLRRSAGGAAYIVVHVPPQHVAEPAFNPNDTGTGDPPYQGFLACPTRIVFE